ncbi:hypothetical protein B7486_76830, partial [cyanobacterium TDX16]
DGRRRRRISGDGFRVYRFGPVSIALGQEQGGGDGCQNGDRAGDVAEKSGHARTLAYNQPL